MTEVTAPAGISVHEEPRVWIDRHSSGGLALRFNDPANPKTNDQFWQRYAELAARLHTEAYAEAAETIPA